jgi:hypothetical protein
MMLSDEIDCWRFAYDDHDSVDFIMDIDDYESQEQSKNNDAMIIDCKMPYIISSDDMDIRWLTYYENQENPWGATNIDCALLQHTNFAVWKDQLPKSYSGRLLARCCSIVEYFARAGDFWGDYHELGCAINVDLTNGTTWWQLLRIMHYNALHLCVSSLSDTQVQESGIDDRTFMYEEQVNNMPPYVWMRYRSCIDIMNCVYKVFVHPIEIVVYR